MHFLAKEMEIYLNLYTEVQDVKFTIISEYITKWNGSHHMLAKHLRKAGFIDIPIMYVYLL